MIASRGTEGMLTQKDYFVISSVSLRKISYHHRVKKQSGKKVMISQALYEAWKTFAMIGLRILISKP
jgi:hypothetical protein